MSRLARAIIFVALGGVTTACATPTQLLIEVRADEELPLIDAIVVELYESPAGGRTELPTSFDVTDTGWVRSFAVVPRGGDASRRVRLVVTACARRPNAGEPCEDHDIVARQQVRAGFVAGQRVVIPLVLSTACSAVECLDDELCVPSGGLGECLPIGGSRPREDASQSECGSTGCVVQIASGFRHTCVVRAMGSVHCWGSNENGRLGDGTRADRSARSAVAVPGLGRALQVATALNRTCALIEPGHVTCWDADQTNEEVVGLTDATRIVAGAYHFCALLSDGSVACWGWNRRGQVGAATEGVYEEPVRVVGLTDVVELAAGHEHTCTIARSGSVACWGSRNGAPLGDGIAADEAQPTPIAVAGVDDAEQIAGGAWHTCIVRRGGRVTCWGGNGFGQSSAPSALPTMIDDVDDAIDVVAGYGHTCVLRRDSSVWCWGYNELGQLGDGSLITRSEPMPVPGVVATAISSLDNHTCALEPTNSLVCWGWRLAGADGRPPVALVPRMVRGVIPSDMALGSEHTCAVDEEAVRCWGSLGFGRLGLADRVGEVLSAPGDAVAALEPSRQVAAGALHTCARTVAGGISCWGHDHVGQLGDGSADAGRYEAAAVPTLADASALAASPQGSASCAVVAGAPWCWGQDFDSVPTRIVGVDQVRAIAVGGEAAIHACAIDDGESTARVWCWGANGEGQLGDGTTSRRTSAVWVPLPDAPTVVATGRAHTCAVAAGRVYCWGRNIEGQLGDGTSERRLRPTEVADLEGVTHVVTGAAHSCALLETGRVRCWGQGGSGELGDGLQLDRSQPNFGVVGVDDAALLAAGARHTCAVLSSGEAVCWGTNGLGQLGDGEPAHAAPTVVLER